MQENEVVNYIKKAFEYKEHECYKQAIEMLYKVLETESDNIEILFQIGELYVLLHNYNRAVQYLEKVFENNKESLYPTLLATSPIGSLVFFNKSVALYILRFIRYFCGEILRFFINILYK